MAINYARNLPNGVVGRTAPEGFTEPAWHVAATADTGTSHVVVGRVYVVQCEWCEEAFVAAHEQEAMEMFRAHEEAMMKEDEND